MCIREAYCDQNWIFKRKISLQNFLDIKALFEKRLERYSVSKLWAMIFNFKDVFSFPSWTTVLTRRCLCWCNQRVQPRRHYGVWVSWRVTVEKSPKKCKHCENGSNNLGDKKMQNKTNWLRRAGETAWVGFKLTCNSWRRSCYLARAGSGHRAHTPVGPVSNRAHTPEGPVANRAHTLVALVANSAHTPNRKSGAA